MNKSLVSINIVDNNKKLYNPSTVPILYYYNGNSESLSDSIRNDTGFIKFLYESKLFSTDLYIKTNLSYFYFDIGNLIDDNSDDNIVENNINIQDLMTLEHLHNIDVQYSEFYLRYLRYHFNDLYKGVFKVDFEFSNDISNTDKEIVTIYDTIKKKYPDKIVKTTVLNYIRSVLREKENLSIENSEWIVKQLEHILGERQ